VTRAPVQALAGIGFIMLSVACFATLDTTTRHISGSVSLLMALWFRYGFQAVATTLAVLPTRGLGILRTAHPKFQLLRGSLLFCCSLLAFYSLKYMPVGEFTAITLMAPLVITLWAAHVLGERVSHLRWALVIGGFLGTMVIVRPGSQHFDWTVILPLILVATNAGFQVLTSKMARTEDPITMHLYTGWIGTGLATLALPFVWEVPHEWTVWAQLVVMGFLATIGHFFLILAYTRAPAASLTPYLYTQIGFAMLGGWLVFDHVPDQGTLMGMALVALCGALGAWLTVREGRVMIQPAES
jgi:drug/metabolite transporter (DMT)-like permease